ncbi:MULTISPECIES: sensor histidine kinase [Streptosporangium]|uniref:histidine kinase n=1 Tax=Streptosporangium brasiliense TaxID=47480 RepID=A0ABT9RD84_9ACTN|nr:histidine kinase [Streptosporangium brasiliense]MDP9867208.1 signal transduction histidine kinase [Streptosporangium brasiliense]
MNWKPSRAVLADTALAVTVGGLSAAATLNQALAQQASLSWSAWAAAAAQLAAGLALILRRRAPVLPVLLCMALCAFITPSAVPFATYAVGVHGRGRPREWAAVLLLSGLFARPWNISGPVPEVLLNTASISLVGIAPALLGMWLASRRRLLQALAERAERAEREQRLMAEQARSEERARLAGEMHDVVTHRVSLMVLRAGALRTIARDEVVREAAEELRQVGCQALEELRELVGVLRSEETFGSARTAEPVVLDLTGLVEESRAAGVEVDLATEGEPVPAPPVVGRTAYRVVQEALTNVHKHAPGARVTVRVGYAGGLLHVCVRDTGGARGAAMVAGEGGTGLSGLRQRVQLVHGSLWAGPSEEGGFEVRASLPVAPGGGAARERAAPGSTEAADGVRVSP